VGYQTLTLHPRGEQLGDLRLHPLSTSLQTVRITADRIRHDANGYTFNLQGSGLQHSNSVGEMLSFLPGISYVDKELLLFDRAPVIYVNGLKMTSQDELKGIIPDRVESVKVDYVAIGEGATARGGVLHIKLKKERDGGFSGAFKESATEMFHYGHQNDDSYGSIEAGIGKWNVSCWAYMDNDKLLGDEDYTYLLYGSGRYQALQTKSRSWQRYFSGRMNISYELAPGQTLAVSNYLSNSDIRKHQRDEVQTFLADTLKSEQSTFLHGPIHNLTRQTVIKYAWDMDERGSNFEVTADNLQTKYHRTSLEDTDGQRLAESHNKQVTDMYRIAPKWTKVFANRGQLKLGVDYQYIHYWDGSDQLANRMYGYIPSAYINYSGRIKNLMYGLGVTLQHNEMKILTEGVKTVRKDWHLCPEANLMWMVSKKKHLSLALTYQHSVDEMPYSVINGYHNTDYANHYTMGNPSLKTPDNDQFMLQFTGGRHFNLMLLYNYAQNNIYYAHGIDGSNLAVTYSRPENSNFEEYYGLQMELHGDPTKWWTTKGSISLLNRHISSPTLSNHGKPVMKLDWNNSFNWSETFGGSLFAHWETGTSLENMTWRPVGHLDVGLWTLLWKSRLRLSVESMLWGKGRWLTVHESDYRSTYHNATRMGEITFTATLYFKGGKKVKQRTEAESIQRYQKIEEKK
jgi:hypothetical protein